MVPNIEQIKLKRIAFQERVCGAIAIAAFLVEAFRIHYDVIAYEGRFRVYPSPLLATVSYVLTISP